MNSWVTNVFSEVRVTLTFDHQNLLSLSLSQRGHPANLKKFPQGVLEISCSLMDGQTT